jgi:heme-degrading monooxygenase HmoA
MDESLEVVRFRVAPEMAQRFVAERQCADIALQQLGGFLGTQLAQGDAGNWVLILRWASRADLQAAQNLTLAPPGVEAVNAWIALASEILSFETVHLRYTHAP